MRWTEKSSGLLALVLAQGAPLGLLGLYRLAGEAAPRTTTLLYIWIGTSLVMGTFGWVLGRQLRALSEANDRLELLAREDALTGLANARALNEELGRQVAQATRSNHPLALVIFDLDHFKYVNDTYGHQMGDNVLRGIGKILRAHARAGDIVARYGGEEFALLLPDTREDQAAQSAERLRVSIEEAGGKGSLPLDITASFGVAELEKGETVFQLFARADRALYAAKHAGRNNVRRASKLASAERIDII